MRVPAWIVVSVVFAAVAGLIVGGIAVGGRCEGRFVGGTEEFTGERLATSLVIGQSDARYGLTVAALGAYIAEVGFGFQVSTVELTAAEVPEALRTGRVDIVLNARQPETAASFDDAVATGTILSTGPTYIEDEFSYSGATSLRVAEVGEDLLEALREMEIPIERVRETEEWFLDGDIEGTHRAAVYFLWNFNYEDSWKSWMPWDPAERLRDKVERYTGLRYPEVYEGIEYDLDRFSRGG